MTGNLKDRSLKKEFSSFLSSFPFFFFFLRLFTVPILIEDSKVISTPVHTTLSWFTHTHTHTHTCTSHCYVNSL